MRWSVESRERLIHSALFLLLRTPVIFILGFAILPGLLGMEDLLDGSVTGVLLLVFILGLFDVGLMFGVGLMKIGRVPDMRSLGWRWEKPGKNLALGVLGFVLCMLGLFLGLWVQTGGVPFGELFQQMASFSLTQRLCFIAIGLLGAAIVEESFYRGYLQPAMISRFGAVGGIIATAIIFDLAHMNFKPAALISKLVSGLVFGFLRGKDGSLMAPAIAHALFWFVVGSI